MTVRLTTTATVPSTTSVKITVYEDTDQDDTAENIESVSIADGTNSYILDTLSGGTGIDYWIEADYTAGSSANLKSATIDSTPAGSRLNTTNSGVHQTTPDGVIRTV
jgi:hypothetical protein